MLKSNTNVVDLLKSNTNVVDLLVTFETRLRTSRVVPEQLASTHQE
jgi:hypothetical protein